MKVHYLVDRRCILTWPCRLRKLVVQGYNKDLIDKPVFIPVISDDNYIRRVHVNQAGSEKLETIEISEHYKINKWIWYMAMAETHLSRVEV